MRRVAVIFMCTVWVIATTENCIGAVRATPLRYENVLNNHLEIVGDSGEATIPESSTLRLKLIPKLGKSSRTKLKSANRNLPSFDEERVAFGPQLRASRILSKPEQQESDELHKGEKKRFRFAGYDKVLAIRSQTSDPAQDRYSLGLNRLRLKLTYNQSPYLKLHVEHDTELRVGSYLDTAEFRQQQGQQLQYWSGGSILAGGNGYYLSQRFFRAYAKLSLDQTDLTIGRQRIPLGTGRNWSTLDMLNPVNPLSVERDEYIGVDAVTVEQKIGVLSKLMGVYSPDPARKSSRWIMRYRTNYEKSDLAFTYGKYWEDYLAGVDAATQLGDAGLRGEWTHMRPKTGRNYQKALLGYDYGFANTLTLSTELYYSSQSREERLAAFARNPLLAQVEPFGDRNLGFIVGYDITPLLSVTGYWLLNLKDRSQFASPMLSYSITHNTNVAGGMQFFSGNDDSEYGRGKDLYFVQFQQYF